jgi:hypothetical protein
MYLEPRSLLQQRRSLVTRIGTAPDGLPRAISINRGTPPERLLNPVARALGLEQKAEEWTGTLRQVAEQVRNLVDARQFVQLTREDGGESTYYLSWANVKTLFGTTLFEEFLGSQAIDVAPQNQPWSSGEEPGTFVDTRAMVMGEVQEEQLNRIGRASGIKFALDLHSEHVAVACIERHTEKDQTVLRRTFLEESFDSLSSGRFCARSPAGSVVEGSFGMEYAKTRRQLGSQQNQWLLTAEKRELIQLCVGLARRLSDYHKSGLVHCDIKPANLLLLKNGLNFIDTLAVPIGDRSPGLSRDYAAPEQILGEAVSAQTDQYAMGIVLSKITSGLLYGEEARFHIPVARARLEIFQMLKSPGVFLAPETLNASKDALTDLKALIERCLRFNPQQRFESMTTLADALEGLLAKHEFSGFIETELLYGNLTVTEELGLCWILEDTHP